jgi:hypothetical protein
MAVPGRLEAVRLETARLWGLVPAGRDEALR